MPLHLDVPAIDVRWTDIPDPCAPVGARGGVAEIGITGVGAAVANAVYTPRVGGFATCQSHQTSFSRAQGEPLDTSPASTRSSVARVA